VVTLSPDSLTVTAGGQVESEVQVRNPGGAPDDYIVEVVGQAQSWAVVEPWAFSVPSGGTGVAHVTFHPAGGVSATVPFEIKVTAKTRPDAPVLVQGRLEPAPLPAPPAPAAPPEPPAPPPPATAAVSATLRPPSSSARASARYVLDLQNAGSTPVGLVLTASDPDGFLAFDIDPAELMLAPGVEPAAIRVRARKHVYLRERVRPFQVHVAPDGQRSFGVPGTFVQERYVPLLLLPFAGAALLVVGVASLIIVVVIVVIFYFAFLK
jgi:hypothetical protein